MPPWRISQSLTSSAGKRGLKHWHMARRSAAGVALAALWGGMQEGITTTRAGFAASMALLRKWMWPLWGGSKVPP